MKLALPILVLAACNSPSAGGSLADVDAAPTQTKGAFVWGSTIRGDEPAFAAWAASHGYSDVYLLIKGTSGVVAYDTLAALLRARDASPAPFHVWAWLAGFSDASHADPAWRYLVGDWVAPDDLAYRAHLVAVTEDAVDPARGHVPEPPDGIMLDDSFQWPSASYGTSSAHRVATLMASIDALRAAAPGLRLGIAPHPEIAAADAYGQDFGELGKRCDVIAPETYRYDYHEPASWIGGVVDAVRAQAGAHAVVVPVLLLYHGDADPTPLAAGELAADRAAAAATAGYGVFRFTGELPTAAQDQVLDNP